MGFTLTFLPSTYLHVVKRNVHIYILLQQFYGLGTLRNDYYIISYTKAKEVFLIKITRPLRYRLDIYHAIHKEWK